MGPAIKLESDFSAAMQELSAEAAQAAPAKPNAQATADISILISAVHSLGQRVESLEESLFRKFETLHFEKVEGQLSEICANDRVNQKLFDSLHQELISYRDNFVRDALQKPFIRDLLVLFDGLSAIVEHSERLAAEGKKRASAAETQGRENLSNMLHFLVEILHRLEVTEMAEKEKVDRNLHRVITIEPAESEEEDGVIVRRLKRGFLWHDLVLRPEEVVAKRLK
ncbi:MAG TPA: nucleotide exchange factor GrpE [Chthoniobacterales bacterium]|jgi:molecular chaperone GrpE (heat shock protein)|nr:nucleotide exchange factor GrpE [Chthoniobacterales bacterium]